TGPDAAGADANDAGWGGGAVRFPLIQGADACGEIAAVGRGVDGARVGERVLVDPILRDGGAGEPARYLGSDRDGAFAEYVCVP
ncbi:alcohol dehydrogenase catalytic domain-containing protein, partial [Klebsiella pneumoniae]|uniref:alcohol dehydrogenase catalytic domain-containing protein n=1 Tax=Klebsiella pneumoniae TaxID=573 RepID=UPI0038554768